MKNLKDYLTEEVDATEYVERGSKDFNDDAVRDNINMLLSKAVSVCSVTPYVAFEKVSKILAVFHIFLPKTAFLEGDHGFKTFSLSQFGRVMGMRNDGEVVTKTDSPYTLYFEWKQNEKGMFDVFSEIVDEDELKDILDDVEDDINTEEPIEMRKEKIDEEAVKSIMSKVKKKIVKTNAPVLRAQLAKAKTEIKQLKTAYRVPDNTKQPAKSMSLSHPAPEPTEFQTMPLSKEKEEHIHKFGYLQEAAKKRALELIAKQRRDYARRKGEEPPAVQGKGGYNVPQKQKKSLKQILSKQEQNRKEAKQARKDAMKAAAQPAATPQKSVVPMHSPKAYDFDSHLNAYRETGNKAHLDAAERHADMDLTKEKLRLSRLGSSGAQRHVDHEWARKMHKARMGVVRDLKGEPKPGIMSRIKAFFKEESLLREEYNKI